MPVSDMTTGLDRISREPKKADFTLSSDSHGDPNRYISARSFAAFVFFSFEMVLGLDTWAFNFAAGFRNNETPENLAKVDSPYLEYGIYVTMKCAELAAFVGTSSKGPKVTRKTCSFK